MPIKVVFDNLASQWKREVRYTSLLNDMTAHPAYQQIIDLGTEAVPLILDELEKEPNHWFCALRSITQVNPVRPENRGRLAGMAQDWLEWGESNGFRVKAR